MGDEQRRARPLGPDALQLEVEPLAGHLVERAERLVEQQHLGLDHERPGDRDPLAHAARQLRGPRLLEALEADELDQVVDDAVRGLDARELERQPDVRDHRAPRQQRGLLERDAEVVVAPRGRGLLAVDERLPARRRLEVGEDAQDRRLAAPRRAEQGGEGPRRRREVDALERDDLRAAGP